MFIQANVIPNHTQTNTRLTKKKKSRIKAIFDRIYQLKRNEKLCFCNLLKRNIFRYQNKTNCF